MYFDGLIGLLNWCYFDEYLVVEWWCGMCECSELLLLMIDVDNFKLYNDMYGYVLGDSVFKQIVLMIECCFGQLGDFVVCFGGEEFVVVMLVMLLGVVWLFGEKIWFVVEVLWLWYVYLLIGNYIVMISIGGVSIVFVFGLLMILLIEVVDCVFYCVKYEGKNWVEIDWLLMLLGSGGFGVY